VPHSIYSTAVLVDATLHHNVEKNSTYAIRAVYSTAFARFVTGFCDIGQNSVVKKSMFEMAESIGMPEAWVELRHEITHGQVPDIRTLEQYVKASLLWLWELFWMKLDAPQADVTHEPTVRAEMRAALKSFLRNRRNEIKTGKTGGSGAATSVADSSKHLLRLMKTSETNTKILISVFFEEKMLLPSQKQYANSTNPVVFRNS
jgi:ribosomal biogenesis protein LAS1